MREYSCWSTTCDSSPTVQWLRRAGDGPTDTLPVFSCGVHAITLDLAARVHEAACTTPTDGLLPACACKPEPLPEPTPAPGEQPTTTLPSGWVVPATEAP